MTDIKAIETRYNGYRFRSRLEARWAVFFDKLGIKWAYEEEGFSCDGVWYLPDFYLPDYRCLFEVKRAGFLEKGTIPTKGKDFEDLDGDLQKIIAMTKQLKVRNDDKSFDYVILASGDPYECILGNDPSSGLVFNGMSTFVDYRKHPPVFEPINQSVAHMPITMETYVAVYNDKKREWKQKAEWVHVFSKLDYRDIEISNGEIEIIPCGKRCISLFANANGVVPRYRGEPLVNVDGSHHAIILENENEKTPIHKACVSARSARFEHGEGATA